jgi:GNAT superfamily N-acetyltransferase
VKVREWDPATASPADIEALRCILNEALDVDLPGDPRWRTDSLREYFAVTMPGERRTCWFAEAGGTLLGYGTVLFLEDIGVLEMAVRPSARRSGVARTLLAHAARRASAEGFESLGVEAVGGTDAVPFYESLGFRCAYVEMRNVLDLASVDWLRLGEMARGVGAGYRIEFHPGGPPESYFAAYAAAKESVREIETGDLDLRPSSYDAERLRASLAALEGRGLKVYIVLAVHEPTDAIAGLTEVVVPAQRPTRADQYDTVVVQAHRGYGIGRAIKARMLFELRAAEPELLDVQTWNAAVNEPMLKVNIELGFHADREWREYEADVPELLQRLG